MKAEVREEVDADIGKLWSFIGDFGGLARWSPYQKGVEAVGRGLGAERRVTTPQDAVVVERVSRYDEAAHSFTYQVVETVPPLPVVGLICTISLEAVDDDRTLIVWSADASDDVTLPPRETLEAGFRQRIDALRTAVAS